MPCGEYISDRLTAHAMRRAIVAVVLICAFVVLAASTKQLAHNTSIIRASFSTAHSSVLIMAENLRLAEIV